MWVWVWVWVCVGVGVGVGELPESRRLLGACSALLNAIE